MPTITVYTLPGCQPCLRQKAALKAAGLAFTEETQTCGVAPMTIVNGKTFYGVTAVETIKQAQCAAHSPAESRRERIETVESAATPAGRTPRLFVRKVFPNRRWHLLPRRR